MQHTEGKNNERRHWLMMATLFFGLCSVYMITYNGRIFSNDEFQALDITTSLTLFGDNRYDEFTWYVWDNYGNLGSASTLPTSPNEPGISLLGIPLYALSRLLPGVGSAHMLLLLNVFFGAGAAALMSAYARLLGYSGRVAIAAALLLGLTTTLWPYTRTYLREPVVLFFLLLAAYLLEHARHAKNLRAGAYIVGAAVAVLFAYLTKETSLFVVIGLAIIALRDQPALSQTQRFKTLSYAGLSLVIILTILLAYTDLLLRLLPDNQSLIGDYSLQSAYAQTAFHSYIFSIGGSIWGTSPVLLLAFPGAWMLLRRNQHRYVWVMLVCVLGFALAHALTAGRFWFGGAAWPTRFLIPVLPFALIPTLPLLEALLHGHWSRRLRLIASISALTIIIYSLWWQIVAASIWWYSYSTVLPPQAMGLNEWLPGINRVEYLRPLLATRLIWELTPDFAWIRLSAWSMGPIFSGLALLAFALLLFNHRLSARLRAGVLILLPIMFAGILLWGLRTIYKDPAYLGNIPELFQVFETIDTQEQPNDIVILDTPRFDLPTLNYSRVDSTRFITFPGPVNNTNAGALSLAITDLSSLLDAQAPRFLASLIAERERIWLWVDSTPMGLRPLERSLVAYFYPIREINTEPPQPWTRLIEFNTIPAPDPVTQPPPAIPTQIIFDDTLLLNGLTLPIGDTYSPGDALPITLHWQSLAQINDNYRVALFLADANNAVATQGQDSAIMQGLLPFNQWLAEMTVLDNRALRLPDNLPAGTYTLWLRLYRFDPSGNIITLPVDNGPTVPDLADTALLPITININVR